MHVFGKTILKRRLQHLLNCRHPVHAKKYFHVKERDHRIDFMYQLDVLGADPYSICIYHFNRNLGIVKVHLRLFELRPLPVKAPNKIPDLVLLRSQNDLGLSIDFRNADRKNHAICSYSKDASPLTVAMIVII